MFEKEAEEYLKKDGTETEKMLNNITLSLTSRQAFVLKNAFKQTFKNGAEFGYNKGKAETALLSQHILDLQKDKGNLTDRVRELEQQIEKMKCCANCKKYWCMCEYGDREMQICEKWEFGN